MEKILFQGDSITDAGRSRTDDNILGRGYATMTAGKLAIDYPGRFTFMNRGIGGDKTTDLYARIKRDILNLAPDYMSLLIGVNDVWHELNYFDGVDAAKTEKMYDAILTETLTALPNLKIILLEPFVLCGSGTEKYYSRFSEEVRIRAEITKRLAEKYKLPFVPLQEQITALAERTSSAYVLVDGVHPTFAGHELISRALCRAYGELL